MNNKGRNSIIMKNNTNNATAVAEKPVIRQVRYTPASAFRAQERFWSEVKRHIVARRPDAASNEDRLY